MNHKLKLLRSIIPLILNVSHYMTDIIYLLYYLEKINKPISKTYRPELTTKIIKLREEFRELLNMKPINIDEGEEGDNDAVDEDIINDEMDGIIKFQMMLNDQDLLLLLHNITMDINKIPDLTHGLKLPNQLNNCELGLNNIINFLNHMVDPDRHDIIYDDTVDGILNEELINVWKVEMDLLNCLIFDIVTHDSIIIDAYNTRYGTNINGGDISKGDTFIKFITWLKDEEVFETTKIDL